MSEAALEYQWMEPKVPLEGVSYPLKVLYCGECLMPLEYCDYSQITERCRDWLERHLPDEFNKLATGDSGGTMTDEEKKRQTRGGKAQQKKKKVVEQHIQISRAPRGKKKFVTVITGLSTCGIDLKVAAKFFGQKFATGASPTGNNDEIVIQGDVKDDLIDILTEKWPEIDEDSIEDLGDMKR